MPHSPVSSTNPCCNLIICKISRKGCLFCFYQQTLPWGRMGRGYSISYIQITWIINIWILDGTHTIANFRGPWDIFSTKLRKILLSLHFVKRLKSFLYWFRKECFWSFSLTFPPELEWNWQLKCGIHLSGIRGPNIMNPFKKYFVHYVLDTKLATKVVTKLFNCFDSLQVKKSEVRLFWPEKQLYR